MTKPYCHHYNLMEAHSLSKEEKAWNKELGQQMDRYSYLRDWSELASWLNKLKVHLSEYKGAIIDKCSLLKKLATSLNGSLPVALHESTLQIYNTLFDRFIGQQDLELVCLGLFSFYSIANQKNKHHILQIFVKHLPKFKHHAKMLASGIIITIVPSLSQINEHIAKEANALLNIMSEPSLAGESVVLETIWVAIMRSNACRIPGLKYITGKIGKGILEDEDSGEDNFWDDSYQEEKPKNKQALQQSSGQSQQGQCTKKGKPSQGEIGQLSKILHYCPARETLVVNALLLCIEDSNILVIKSALDFLIKYMPLKGDFISDAAKMKLAVGVVSIITRKDVSLLRKVSLFFFGKPDLQNRYVYSQERLKYLIFSLLQILKNPSSGIEPLKIILNLYTEHEDLPQVTLKELSKELVMYCQSRQSNQEIGKLINRMIDRIQVHVPLFCQSLGSTMLKAVRNQEYSEAERTLYLMVYFLDRMIKVEDRRKTLGYVLRTIIQGYMTSSWKDRDFIKLAMKQTLDILSKYKDIVQSINGELSDPIYKDHIKLYSGLIESLSEKEDYSTELHLINVMQLRLYQYFEVYNEEYVDILIANLYLSMPQHYLPPIEAIADILDLKNSKAKAEIVERATRRQKVLEEQSSQETVNSQQQNYLEKAIEKLWSILSVGHLQAKIMPLLLKLIGQFPKYFSKILSNQFAYHNELSIIKFNIFWSLSPKYPQLLLEKQLEDICKPGLFMMLELLDAGNPLVKYNTNIWINESFPNFERVLNPLVEILLKPSGFWYCTFQGQYISVITPDFQLTMRTVKFLISILKHTGKKFYVFCLRKLTQSVLPYYQHYADINVSSKISPPSYLAALLQIVIRLVSTKYSCVEDPGLNLLCCQLLETLVQGIDSNETSAVLIDNLKDILQALHFATINSEHLLQLQLLGLLNTIFFKSAARKMADPSKLKDVINDQSFSQPFLEGLSSSFPYVKERFVQFLNQSISLIVEFHSVCSEMVSKIMNSYMARISLLNNRKMELSAIDSQNLQISKINTEILILFNGIKQLLCTFLNLRIRKFDKEKNQKDSDLGVFSLYSWKSFVSLRVDSCTIEFNPKFRKIVQEISRQVVNQFDQILFTMASCWSLSELITYYKLSAEGLDLFQYEDFHQFNRMYFTLGKFETEHTIQNFILNLLRVLINKYPKEVIGGLIKNWASAKTIQFKLKLLQILNLSCIPVEDFYNILSESLFIDTTKKKKNNTLFFEPIIQQQILSFCQVFTHYSLQTTACCQASSQLALWAAFMRFVRLFDNTRNLQSLHGLIELIDLFIKKNNPKQILKDYKMKKEILLILQQLNEVVAVCTGKTKLASHLSGEITLKAFLPLPSSLYQIYVSQVCKLQDAKVPYLFFSSISVEKALEYSRIHSFFIVKRVAFNILQVCYHDNEVGLVKKVRELMTAFLPIVQDKNQPHLLIQCASEMVLSILQKKHMFLKQFKPDILQIFNKDDFFICSSKTLHCWAKIIDAIIDNDKDNRDHDIFIEYLSKVSLVSSIFSSYNLETKKKIKSFERICFILYAGSKDKYMNKAHLLVDKIIEVVKTADAPQPVLILIFFCIRILILRMSPDKLTKLLSSIWQLIMFLLINIFKDSSKDKNNLNLVWAALKLIQMLSIMDITEFHPHQWMFFYDFVGVKLTVNSISSINGQGSKGLGESIISQGSHKPLIDKYLPEGILPLKSTGKQVCDQSEMKRHLIIKEQKIDDICLMNTKALLLSSYLISNNQQKRKCKVEEVQELIQNDFLNLDEFIFKFK